MSGTFLPLEGGRTNAAPAPVELHGGDAARRQQLAKAARQFQSLFLMELLKPLTQEFGSDASDGAAAEGNSAGMLSGNNRDLYSWFWNEALAGQLSRSWPLPPLPGTEAAGKAPATGAASVQAQKIQARTIQTGTARPTFLPLPSATTAPLHLQRSAAAVPAALTRTQAVSGGAPSATTGSSPATAKESAPAAPLQDAPASGNANEPRGILDQMVDRVSNLFQLPVNLVRAVVRVESGGRADSVSQKGAVGLMQVMPQTAQEMGVRNPSDPWQNLYAGVKYLSKQLAQFGNVSHALAAYNAGPGAVKEHGGVPPYPETQAYVRRVLAEKARLDQNHPVDA